MEPENDKPGANEAETDAKQVEGKAASKGGEARVVAGGGPRMAPRGMNERRFAKVSRRELLKVVGICDPELSGVASQEGIGIQ